MQFRPKFSFSRPPNFNAALLAAAVLAVGAGIYFDLAASFLSLHDAGPAALANVLLSILVVKAVAFPIFVLRHVALIRKKNRELHLTKERAVYAAQHDPLTGLGNRRRYNEIIQGKQKDTADQTGLALLLIDLDHFKPVNDLRGHDVGDQVLIEVAKRLRLVAPPEAEVVRFGGDEFAVILTRHDHTRLLEDLADQLIDAIREPITIGNFKIVVSASCGISEWARDMRASDVLTHADQALYAAKDSGRADFRFFDAKLGRAAREEALLGADLLDAVLSDQLHCVFQPYQDLGSDRLVGAEALARWCHPTMGHIPPDRFIKIADGLGLIDKLSDQLLEQACRAAQDWPDDLILSFNITPTQFSDPQLVSRILRVLDRFGRPCDRFEVELTEHVLLADAPRARVMMQELIDAGVHIALDDFGTGTASLSLLTSYPFTRLKIDRTFVRNIHNDAVNLAVTTGIAHLAHSLDMVVTAEGIEHPAELEVVRQLQPIMGQGFLLGRPMSAQDFQAMAQRDRDYPKSA